MGQIGLATRWMRSMSLLVVAGMVAACGERDVTSPQPDDVPVRFAPPGACEPWPSCRDGDDDDGGGGGSDFSVSIELRDAAGDRITSDVSSLYEDGVDANDLRIRDDGILLWNLGDRDFLFDFTDVIDGGGGLPADHTVGRVGGVRVLATEDNQDELTDHFLGMADGESLPGMFKTRAEFGTETTYQLRYQRPAGDASIDDAIASGSSFLTVVRNGSSGPCAIVDDECWTIEARTTGLGPGEQDDWSMVFSRSGSGGSATYADEGSFHMPFRMTVICPDCPAASTDDPDDPPSVSVTNPVDGSTVSGTVEVTADASDDGTVSGVEFFVDGSSFGTDSEGSDGWSASWNTTEVSDGGHTVSAVATDDGGQTGSDAVSVTVDNVDDPPEVNITNPADGSTVSGTVEVTADASDDSGVTQVEFLVDGSSLGTDADGSDGWSASWATDGLEDGSIHTVSAEATDEADQTTSDAISVTVDNSAPASMHVADLDGSSTSQGRTWTATIQTLVLDSGGNPVADATVEGSWSTGASSACTTDSNGLCAVSEAGIHKRNGSATFTVENVDHADLAYDQSANTDPDGDSDGTSITVNKP